MPSGRQFEEDTWDQRTWTMSWGVTLNWDEPLFIPHTLLLLFFPIRLLSRFIHLRSLWTPSLFSLFSQPSSFDSAPLSSVPVSRSSHAFPAGHCQANANIPQCESSSLIAYLTISTHTFSARFIIHEREGLSPYWDIPAFLQLLFSHRQYTKLGDWHFAQQLTAASSCMTQWHRSSARVAIERQRYGVVAKALLSNTHLIPIVAVVEPHAEEGVWQDGNRGRMYERESMMEK